MNSQAIKEIVSRVLDTGPALDAIIRLRRQRYILCYHRIVSPDYAAKNHLHHSMWVAPETFSRQLQWMKDIGEIVPLDTIMDEAAPQQKPWFCLTFDDGWQDNHELAFPIMKSHGVHATIFIVTDAINTGNLFWVDEFIEKTLTCFVDANRAKIMSWAKSTLGMKDETFSKPFSEWLNTVIEALKELLSEERRTAIVAFYALFAIDAAPIKGLLMSWEQIREMQDAGFDFQSHTHTHEIFSQITPDMMRFELAESKTQIEAHLGNQCRHFCYPNARYNPDYTHLVGEAGYRYGYKIDNEPLRFPVDRFLVPRMLVCENYSRVPGYLKLRLLQAPIYNIR